VVAVATAILAAAEVVEWHGLPERSKRERTLSLLYLIDASGSMIADGRSTTAWLRRPPTAWPPVRREMANGMNATRSSAGLGLRFRRWHQRDGLRRLYVDQPCHSRLPGACDLRLSRREHAPPLHLGRPLAHRINAHVSADAFYNNGQTGRASWGAAVGKSQLARPDGLLLDHLHRITRYGELSGPLSMHVGVASRQGVTPV
jgi:hypothetical protein